MGNVTAKTSGEIASFKSPTKANIKSLKVHFSPKQSGSGDPSPENVRPISGWDGINVYTLNSENLIPLGAPDDVFSGQVESNGTISSSSSYECFCVHIGKNTTLQYQRDETGTTTLIAFADEYLTSRTGAATYGYLNMKNRVTRTVNSGEHPYLIICVPKNNYHTAPTTIETRHIMLSIGEGVKNFAERKPINKTAIDWSNEVGVVYGGYVDLISGELIEEWNKTVLDSSLVSSFLYSSSYNGWWINLKNALGSEYYACIDDIPSKGIVSDKFKSSEARGTYANAEEYVIKTWYGKTGEDRTQICLSSSLLPTTTEEFEVWLNENNPTICFKLLNPITHQLTPTQLSSFIGQNNFWSNADYVEVEYELSETFDIQKAKRKIIMNQPHVETVTNKIASFNPNMIAPMKNCKIYFKPIQLGSGDPSPTNVRNINGWTGIDSYVNGDKISVDWTSDAGTVYGGYLDLAKGEVVAEYNTVDLGTLTCAVEYDEAKTYSLILPSATTYQEKDEPSNLYCSSLTPLETVKTIGLIRSMGFNNIAKRAQNTSRLYVRSELDTTDTVKASLAGYIVAYKLAEPIHYPLSSLSSQQLLTLKSTNHIWSETNGQQIDVKYWTHKNLTPTPLTNYLENQTWTDSAYISSSGKKTTGGTSASHFLTNQILLEAGTYVLSGFSYYVGTDNTNYRIHAYDSTGKWLRQIAYKQIGNLSPVDISFTLDTDTYVNVSIAMDFDGVLAKIN